MGTSPVTRLDEKLRVRAHERPRHRHLRAIRQYELGPIPELLDDAEDVVPAARVEPARVIAKLVQDLVHLERGENRLDEDRGADRPTRNSELVLREVEHVIPQPCLEVAFQLRQIEVRPAAPAEEPLGVVEEVETEVEQAARYRLAVEQHMPLLEVPAAGPDQKRRNLLVQP